MMLCDNPIRVMVVDDHAMTRRGLAAFLRTYSDLEFAGEAASGNAAIESCSQIQPDVVLMDMIMPGIDGASATSIIRENWPKTQVIALTSFQDTAIVQKALQAGAIGFLYKDVSADDLASAIRAACAGFGMFSPGATRDVVQPSRTSAEQKYGLTSRELEVLGLMVCGLHNTKIAEKLTVSPSTIKTHVSSILHKIGAVSRAEAASLAVREGIIS